MQCEASRCAVTQARRRTCQSLAKASVEHAEVARGQGLLQDGRKSALSSCFKTSKGGEFSLHGSPDRGVRYERWSRAELFWPRGRERAASCHELQAATEPRRLTDGGRARGGAAGDCAATSACDAAAGRQGARAMSGRQAMQADGSAGCRHLALQQPAVPPLDRRKWPSGDGDGL